MAVPSPEPGLTDTPPRVPRHALAFVLLTVLIDTIGFGIVIPVLPELVMELTGQGLSEASRYGGYLAFAYAVMQFLCAPVMGNLSDRFGRRPVLLLSLAAFGLDYLLMGLAPSLGWLVLGRVVAGITGAAYSTANAVVADITPADRRAQNFGLIGATFGIGFILGPALGGYLGELGPRAPFFAAAGLALLNVTYGALVLPETLAPGNRRPFRLGGAHPVATLRRLAAHPGVLGLAVAIFLWQLSHQALPSVWSYYTMFKFAWSERMVGLSLAAAGVSMIVVQGGLTRVLIPRLGERRAAVIGLTMGTLGYLGYALATRGWMMYAFLGVSALAGLTYPSLNALMSQAVGAAEQGALQGGVSSLYGLSSIVGPLLMTQLFGFFSRADAPVSFPGAAFAASALLAGASLLIVLRRRPEG